VWVGVVCEYPTLGKDAAVKWTWFVNRDRSDMIPNCFLYINVFPTRVTEHSTVNVTLRFHGEKESNHWIVRPIK